MQVMPDDFDRYRRQVALPMIGVEGQRRLAESHALVVGCGALGSVVVEQLARAGVGTLTVVDRDVVEWSNLQRQSLFDEDDARSATPKAEAAKARIARVNGAVKVRAYWDDFGPRNALRYALGAQVIIDGLDNLESRYLLNDIAVKLGVPYVYGAAVSTHGMCAVVRPGLTPCLRCIVSEPPPVGTVETCESVGVLAMATAIVANLEAAQAIKLLVGANDAVEPGLMAIDVWTNQWRQTNTRDARDPRCICCGERRFEFLDCAVTAQVTALCGQNSVQISPPTAVSCDLDSIAARLVPHGQVERAPNFVRVRLLRDEIDLAVFADGRVVVRGTTEPDRARSIVARYVGI